jgi:hypothetical protein
MMSKSKKGAPVKVAEGQDGFDVSTEEDVDRATNELIFDNPPYARKDHPSHSPVKVGPRLKTGFSFAKGSKSAMDNGLPSDLPVYHIRVRDVRTGGACILQVNSLTEPPPEGYLNQETWANECLDGGASLTLKKEPLPPLNPLTQDIDLSVPDVALVPMPVTPLKKSKPCTALEVKQMHLTSGTDVLYISPDSSPNGRAGAVPGSFLGSSQHSLQSASPGQSTFDLNSSAFDAVGVVDWNHPIAKLHIPTPAPQRSQMSTSIARPKTQGQKMMERTKKEKPLGRQSDEAFSGITNRSRPNGEKFKKIPMNIADVASIKPSTTLPMSDSMSIYKSASSYREDSLGAKSVGKKLRGTVVLTASQTNSTLLNSLSESQFH